MMNTGHKREGIIVGLFIFFIVALLRLPIFFLSHQNNDELIHLALAMKIDTFGTEVFSAEQYNLWYVEKGIDHKQQLVGIFLGDRRIGSLLEGFLGERSRFSHHPPLLPFCIALSHKLWADRIDFLVNLSENIYLMAHNFIFQAPACIVPFVFSLLLLYCTYLLGRMFFSEGVGLLAALLLGLTPAALLSANKIWADDMTAFFATLAAILYLYSVKNNKPFLSLFSGLACGLAIIAKMSGIYIIITVLIFHVLVYVQKRVSLESIKSFCFDRKILYFLAGAFIVSAWWFNAYDTNHHFFTLGHSKWYFAVNETWGAAKTWSTFFSRVSNRPWFTYFVLMPIHTPLFLFSYVFMPFFALRKKIKRIGLYVGHDDLILRFLLIWMIVPFIFLTLKPGKEMRYLLIAYPAVAILSAYCFRFLYEWFNAKEAEVSVRLRNIFFISIIMLSIFYSLKIALPSVFFRSDLIVFPF